MITTYQSALMRYDTMFITIWIERDSKVRYDWSLTDINKAELALDFIFLDFLL